MPDQRDAKGWDRRRVLLGRRRGPETPTEHHRAWHRSRPRDQAWQGSFLRAGIAGRGRADLTIPAGRAHSCLVRHTQWPQYCECRDCSAQAVWRNLPHRGADQARTRSDFIRLGCWHRCSWPTSWLIPRNPGIRRLACCKGRPPGARSGRCRLPSDRDATIKATHPNRSELTGLVPWGTLIAGSVSMSSTGTWTPSVHGDLAMKSLSFARTVNLPINSSRLKGVVLMREYECRGGTRTARRFPWSILAPPS
jgi:hypothetical protein